MTSTSDTTERGPLSWMLECEGCGAAFVSPTRGQQRDKPCPQCGGDVIILGAGYPSRDAEGAIVAIDPVSMLSREVAEATLGDMVPVRNYTNKPLPKAKKRSGKSPTRKVIPVQRSRQA